MSGDDQPDDQRSDQASDQPDDPLSQAAFDEELGRALGHDPTAVPPPDRIAALRAAAQIRVAAQTPIAQPSRRRAFVTGSIAAGVAGIAGYLASDLSRSEPAPAQAVPMEQITFAGDAEVSTSALINHTWGTELLLDVSGLDPGKAFTIVYDTETGEVSAGSLLAVADVVMKCRFNAASTRSAVRAIEVRAPSGDTVLRAQLPTSS